MAAQVSGLLQSRGHMRNRIAAPKGEFHLAKLFKDGDFGVPYAQETVAAGCQTSDVVECGVRSQHEEQCTGVGQRAVRVYGPQSPEEVLVGGFTQSAVIAAPAKELPAALQRSDSDC